MSPLQGYTVQRWPELTANRNPSSESHVASKRVIASADVNLTPSVILLSIARIIAAYFGVSDLLFAIERPSEEESVHALRIQWDENRLWREAIAQLDPLFTNTLVDSVPLSVAREILGTQDPCLALCTFNAKASFPSSQFPCHFSYNSTTCTLTLVSTASLLHPSVAEQLLGQVTELITNVVQFPDWRLAALPSFSANLMSIYDRLPEESISTVYPHISCVSFAPDYLKLRAQNMADSTAVRWYSGLSFEHSLEPVSITYLDLHQKANQVARWLLARGLRREDRVAVCLDRNLHFHAAMMGVMRAGGCYVPIDPELPLERKSYIAKDADVAFVLTSSVLSPSIFGSKAVFFEDDDVQTEICLQSTDDVEGHMIPEGLSYMLYTSGTTGNPKGCLLTHHGLAQAILALSSTAADVRMDNIHDGRYLAVASIAFDVHLAETIVPMALGMPLLSARRSQLLENLPSYVNLLGVTHLGIVPSLIEATLNASQSGKGSSDIALRYIASGGEKMSDAILDKWADHPQVRLANFYGPSEVTIGCCARYMSSTTPRANIGKALANVSAYVVDDKLNVLPRGAPGELVVEGPLVGRGYHGRPDLTAKVFLEWPRKGCWAYRTGDLVRMMPDSTIEILGRIDTQIKLRGVRIESEGISAVVRGAVPSTDGIIMDAVTILAKHPAIGVEQLVTLFSWQAVAVATRKAQLPNVTPPPPGMLTQIKVKCNAELASYMRPSHFVPLSWLPLSSNGKTDAKLLTQYFNDIDIDVLAGLSTIDSDSTVRACTPTEQKIFEVLSRYVSLPFTQPRPDMSVFECGLDSMAVIRFTSELKTALGSSLSASDVMKFPVLSDIAAMIEKSQSNDQDEVVCNTETQPIPQEVYLDYTHTGVQQILSPFPCQEGVLSRSIEQDTLYVQHVLVALKEETSVDHLRKAWEAVVLRHPILRTVFYFGRNLYQVVLTGESSHLHWAEGKNAVTDSNLFADYFFQSEAPDVVKQINSQLSSSPPYRITLYSAADGKRFFTLSIHHALFDGISLPLLFEDVEREYTGQAPHHLPDPATILATIPRDLHAAETFWKAEFAGFSWPAPVFAQVPSTFALKCAVPLQTSLSSLKNIASAQRVTLQGLLTCAFASILAGELYGSKDVVFGIVRSGRLVQVEGIDSAICPLVSVVPMRVNFENSTSILSDIQSKISSLVDFEHVPLGKVQGWLRPGQPMFEVLFSLSVKKNITSELWDVVESEPPQPDYPLAVEVVLDPETDSLSIQAAWLDHNQTGQIHQCLHDFEEIVKGISNSPNSYLSNSLSATKGLWRPSSVPLPSSLHSLAPSTAKVDPAVFQLLQRVTADFMQINPVILTPTTSLVSMGLDSIKSVGLAKRLAKEGLKITSTDLLQAGTFNAVASRIASYDMDAATPTYSLPDLTSEVELEHVRFSPNDEVKVFPTTALQAGMLSQTVNSEGKLYIHAFPLVLSPETDMERLESAWNEAVSALSILRTTFHFVVDSGHWVQAVHSEAPLKWSHVSVDSLEEYQTEARQFVSTLDVRDEKSFHVPPLWMRSFSVGNTQQKYLVVVMHHALYDGLSVGKLLHAVHGYYVGNSPTSIKQFHELLPNFIHQEKEGSQFWIDRLRRYHPYPLRHLHPDAKQSPVFVELSFAIDKSQFRNLLKRAGVTPQCVAQAAWVKVLARESKGRDIVFGHTVSGRNTSEAEEVIGPVLNTIPFMIQLGRFMQDIDLLRSVHQSNVDSLAWHHASLRDIQKKMGVDSLWDSLFLYQFHDGDETGQDSLWKLDSDTLEDDPKIQYPLNLEVQQRNDSITIQCASRSTYYDQSDLMRLVRDLQSFIEAMICKPDNPISIDLPGIFENRSRPQAQAEPTSETPLEHEDGVPLDLAPYQQLFAELTGTLISKIQASTPLVALGIDSITAIQIASKLRGLGHKIATTEIISSRTIGDVVRKISALGAPKEPRPILCSVVNPDEIKSIYEWLGDRAELVEKISFVPPGMKWLISAWQRSQGTRYHHAFAFKLPSSLDHERLRAAWSQLVEKHWLLRSTFCYTDKLEDVRLVTFRKPEENFWTENADSPVSLYEQMQTIVSQPPHLRFPQARAILLKSSNHLVLHLHHFQYDAWSLALLVDDLASFYHDTPSQSSADVDNFTMHYFSSKDRDATQEQYWRHMFPPGQFQPSYVPSLLHNAVPHPHKRVIKTKHFTNLRSDVCLAASLQLQVSLQSIYLACWSQIQAELTSSSAPTFGLWHSGRTGMVEDIDRLAAPCMNVLPLRVNVPASEPLLDLARRIQVDLQSRSDIIEQTDLATINRLAGLLDKPICNVFVNIIKVAQKVQSPVFMEPIEVPYWVPEQVPVTLWDVSEIPLTSLLRDDIMIDIGTGSTNVIMSVDAADHMLDERAAESLMDSWADKIKEVLGL